MQQTRREQAQADAGGGACEKKSARPAQHEQKHVCTLCSQRETKAEFTRAQRDQIRQQAVKPGQRDDQGETAQSFQQMGRQQLRAHRVRDDLVHRANPGSGQIGVELLHHVVELGNQAASLAAGAQHDVRVGLEKRLVETFPRPHLGRIEIDLRHCGICDAVLVEVVDDTYNFGNASVRTQLEVHHVAAEGRVDPGKGTVHDGHLRGIRGVLRVEVSAARHPKAQNLLKLRPRGAHGRGDERLCGAALRIRV